MFDGEGSTTKVVECHSGFSNIKEAGRRMMPDARLDLTYLGTVG